MRKMPPDFGCCACATDGAASATATAKQRSLVISSSQFCSRGRSPTVPLLFLDAHANRCDCSGQPGPRSKSCGLSASRGLPHRGMAAPPCGSLGFGAAFGQVAETQGTGNAVSKNGSIVAETAERIFADLADPQAVT